MKSTYIPFAAKIRRYKHLAKQINRMLKDGSFRLLDAGEQKKLLLKLKERLKSIGHLFPQRRLRETLAGIALLLGTALGNPLEAQTFAPAEVNPFGIAPGTTYGYPAFVDIDGDGDLDMIVSSYDYDSYQPAFIFYENIGTPESSAFSADVFEVNPFGLFLSGYASTPAFADFDNDGDFDLLIGDLYNSGFLFFENTGTATAPAFAGAQTTPFGLQNLGIELPTVADLDNDGDLDVLSGSLYSTIRYFQNVGTPEAPSFAAPVVNPFGLSPNGLVTVPNLADLDGDGDLDLLYMLYGGGSQIWYAENTGTPESPAFAAPVVTPFGISANGLEVAIPVSADIDNDGDLDVFINSYYGDIMYFYENTSISVQFPPTAANSAVTALEDSPYEFGAGDFNFMDPNPGDNLQAVRIVSLPALGELKLNGAAVAASQEIDVADLSGLTFEALPDENGSPYTTFEFQVSDGTDWSVDAYLMTVNVDPVNDAPASANSEINLLSNETHTFASTDFPFSDVDGDDLAAVQIISNVDRGVLQLNGTNVTVGQEIPVAELGQLTYQPVFNEEGVPYTTFDFKVSDGVAYSDDAFTMTVNVTGPLSSHDAQLDAAVQLSPNPASDFIQLIVEAAQALGDLSVVIFDETGRTALTAGFAKQGQQFQQSLNVAEFAAGVYWIKIESGGKFKTLKFVKF